MSRKFQMFCILVLSLVVGIVFSDDEADEHELRIEVTYVPNDCPKKSNKFDQLSMHYTGTVTETGVQFDANNDKEQPFQFQLGVGQVIKGWDEGLLEMCVGEKRLLNVPASKAYGEQGAGEQIPPNADLTFVVELLKIEDGVPPANVFKEIDKDNDKKLSQDEVSIYLKLQAENSGEKITEKHEEQHDELLTQIFTHEDKDKDGFISHEEFSGPKHDEL